MHLLLAVWLAAVNPSPGPHSEGPVSTVHGVVLSSLLKDVPTTQSSHTASVMLVPAVNPWPAGHLSKENAEQVCDFWMHILPFVPHATVDVVLGFQYTLVLSCWHPFI